MNKKFAIILHPTDSFNPLPQYYLYNQSISPLLNKYFKFELPVIDINFTEQLASYSFVFYEIIFDYSRFSYLDFLNNQTIPPIIEERVRNGTAGLLLTILREGYIYVFPEIHHWAKQKNYPIDKIFYVTGAINGQGIYDKMHNDKLIDCTEKINILKFQLFEFYQDNSVSGKVSSDPIKKKFLCLNRMSKAHRLASLAFLQKYNIIDNCYVSYGDVITDELRLRVLKEYNGSLTKDDINKIVSPIHLDHTQGTNANDTNPKEGSSIESYFNSSLFSIVNETLHDTHFSEYNGVPVIFLSDKTYKTFYFHHIPIINAGRGVVRYLRDSGYDMFDDIIDHGYNDVLDPVARLTFMIEQIRKLDSKYSLQDCEELRNQLTPRLEKNREFLVNYKGKFSSMVMDDFNEATKWL